MAHPREFAEGLSIGIIMDGNGRWAKNRGLPRTAGHKKGAEVFSDIADYCDELGVSSVYFYAFSTENWKRPLEEVNAIMRLFGEYLLKGFDYKNRNIRIKFMGDRTVLDEKLQRLMNKLEGESAVKTGMTLNIAINYGGRPEIVRAAQQLAEKAAAGQLKPEEITEQMLSDAMYTAGQKDPDFILRPSGEKRLSNFMLWQAAYAELVEMDVPTWTPPLRSSITAAAVLAGCKAATTPKISCARRRDRNTRPFLGLCGTRKRGVPSGRTKESQPMKTRIITAIVGIIVLIGVMFTFNTLIFNLVIAAITLIAIHEIYNALGFTKKDWLMYAALVPYTLLVMTSNYMVMRRLVMPVSFVLVTFYAIYLVVRNGTISYQKASGLLVFSGIVIFCFYSFIRLKELLPVEQFGYDAVFFILLILCFAWGGDTCAYFAGRAFGKHKLCPVVSPKKTVEGAIGGVLGTMVFGVVATLIYSVAADRMEAFTRSNIGVSMYVIIALLGCVAAVLGIYGDLFASVVKRQCGIKDYGTIFPGHGGILDRFDSVMFIAPFVTMVITAVFYK